MDMKPTIIEKNSAEEISDEGGSMTKPKLTDKQERFISEYLIDLNAKQAAIRAGYSKKTAKDIGCQNLAKLYIQEAIQKAVFFLQFLPVVRDNHEVGKTRPKNSRFGKLFIPTLGSAWLNL